MKRSKVDSAVDIVRIVSLLADKGDYSGIADGDDTPLGALAHAIEMTENGRSQMTNEQIVSVFAAIVRSVPPRVLTKLHAAARYQEAYHLRYALEDAEAAVRPAEVQS